MERETEEWSVFVTSCLVGPLVRSRWRCGGRERQRSSLSRARYGEAMLRTSAAVPRTSLRGPPRRPPRSLQLRVLLSWPLLSALFFTCLGGASLSTCTVPGVVDELRLMSDGTRVLGTVDHVQFTRVTINKKPVYQYDYSFELDGEHYLASDYSYRSVGPANGRMYVEVA